ncbi:hypothetical protein GOBAR_DD36786 [Gossypium barbadense]|nr:hypothetical protein GOBAR_DD36786 [Gossypium barbadense]
MLSLASTSSSVSRKKYDVFLSFRGEDTRKKFTDHLYDALKRSGIVTFRDDPKLEAGEEIAPELFKAIQQSWCSVIVFSESYASSGWCLDELTEIVKQKNDKGYKVFPVFYDVDPSDLRKQKGKVEEAFAEHEKRYDEDKLQRWRNALTEVANIKGWHLNGSSRFPSGGRIKFCTNLSSDFSKRSKQSDNFRKFNFSASRSNQNNNVTKTRDLAWLVRKVYHKLLKSFVSRSFENGSFTPTVTHIRLENVLTKWATWEKSVDEPGKRCRLWAERDVYHVLTKNTVTEMIEGMIIDNKILPSCLTQLPKLERLLLTGCKALKSVPELPANKLKLNIDGCTSLETVAYPSKICTSRYSANFCNSKIWAGMVAVNCFRLAENVDALTLLKKELKVFGSRAMFDIVLPGSEIPKRFSQQRGDSWIKIDLPLEVRNDSQWMGVAFCCIFVCDDASSDEHLRCRAIIHDRYSSRKVDWSGWSFGIDEQVVKKDHIFIRYFSRDKLYPIFLEDKCGEHDETKNLWMIDCLDQECHQLELSMISLKYPLFKVKKCGVRIMYEKDLEEMEQIQELHSSQCCANCEDIQQHSTDDGSIGNGSLVKRKRNIYEEMDEAPQPKRMQKVFNSIMRLGKKH